MKLWDSIKTALNSWATEAQNSYDAASTTGRRTKGWLPGAGGPRSTVNANLATLRNRSRDQIRNNGLIAHGITSLVVNEVGKGIVPRSRAESERARKNIDQLWKQSMNEIDADGVLNFYGMQSLASRTRRGAGEVFLRRRRRSMRDGLAVPMQVQIIEPEFVPLDMNKDLPNGNKIVAGIEFNRRGQRVAYHVYKEHPGESSGFGSNETVRVPAKDIIHHYVPLRPGQIRGEPDAVAALLSARDFRDYQDAELVRKKTRAPFTGFMERASIDYDPDSLDPITGLPKNVEDDLPELAVSPGTFLTGLPGERLVLFEGDNAGEGYEDYIRSQMQLQAVALNLPYEILSGDWKDVNDRLVRVILNEFHRYIESIQDHYMIHQVCGGVWRWWLDAAVLSGAISAPGYANKAHVYQMCEWRPHGWDYIHPVQDVEAKLMAIAGGLTSRSAEVAKKGGDVEEVDQQNREDRDRAADLGYTFGSDQINEDASQAESDEGDDDNVNPSQEDEDAEMD